ncbi:MAG: hypothetical protein HY282_10325 [Nitrospirae bacterium]|nr:hypothetical protein [Candidatus Manganitrophaceae bacterium]
MLLKKILIAILGFLILSGSDLATAEDSSSLADAQVRLYFNYYWSRYTNTPLLIRRDCVCQVGYQSGIGILAPLPMRFWLNFHTYVIGGTPGLGESNEQFGVRLEGQYHFERVTLLIGLHNEWNVDRPSNFPTTSENGQDVHTTGLRETYVGATWWIKK